MRTLIASFVVLVAAVSVASAQENAPSFDCTASLQPVEALICADQTLAGLDRDLSEAYHAALTMRTGDAQSALRMEQRAWAGNRAGACGVDADPAIEGDGATACLVALYRGRISELRPGDGRAAVTGNQSGYGWLMGNWSIVAVRGTPSDAATAQIGRTIRLAEAPIVTPRNTACSFPHYSAEPSPGVQFGDLADYPAAVMVRVTCVGIALLDVVRLTDDRILLGEGNAVFELERRR
jgi:uncharacterized protein YecT (DUF1311 family)